MDQRCLRLIDVIFRRLLLVFVGVAYIKVCTLVWKTQRVCIYSHFSHSLFQAPSLFGWLRSTGVPVSRLPGFSCCWDKCYLQHADTMRLVLDLDWSTVLQRWSIAGNPPSDIFSLFKPKLRLGSSSGCCRRGDSWSLLNIKGNQSGRPSASVRWRPWLSCYLQMTKLTFSR